MLWFIDMERCDLNLEVYILRDWTPKLHTIVPFFTAIDLCPTPEKINQVGEIMRDVVKGVAFIHSQQMIHRDLKPRNGSRTLLPELTFLVLYSRAEHSWKIADFGTASEATSKCFNTTRYARGTPCYRAPEVLDEEAKYNNKADIWSLGCVVLEMFAGRRPWSREEAIGAIFKLGSLNQAPPIPDDVNETATVDGLCFMYDCFQM